jgi:hypothetical protein
VSVGLSTVIADVDAPRGCAARRLPANCKLSERSYRVQSRYIRTVFDNRELVLDLVNRQPKPERQFCYAQVRHDANTAFTEITHAWSRELNYCPFVGSRPSLG